jgi:palmitoyl-protein thioesterase
MHVLLGLIAFPLLALCQPPRPLVVWHGLGRPMPLDRLHWSNSTLGDSYNSTGMAEFQALVSQVHPGIFLHSVYIDENQDNDRKAGFVRPYPYLAPIESILQDHSMEM